MWYNPINKDNNHLCNFLGVFFPAFASNRFVDSLILSVYRQKFGSHVEKSF